MHTVKVHDITIGSGGLVLIAGPCVIESAGHALFMAQSIRDIAMRIEIPYIFKASFDKANRSSIESYRGPGFGKGLEILGTIRERLSVPVVSDIHEPAQAAPAAKVLDLLQIPAFLCRQTDLLVAAGSDGPAGEYQEGAVHGPRAHAAMPPPRSRARGTAESYLPSAAPPWDTTTWYATCGAWR